MLRLVRLAIAILLLSLGAGGAMAGQSSSVLVGHITGPIGPITARYVERVIADGESGGAVAVVFVIDTPGGLIDSTYRITTAMLNARIPVLTYVGPSGARAASAGTFITLAGHVAAMAPATNIGAAHPVDSSGGDIKGDLRTKAENDAAAQITKIARARGRNVQWAEDAVRRSVSIRDDEAISIGVVDLGARDVADLLTKADGREVSVGDARVRLATSGATIVADDASLFETILRFVVDPQIALLLFTLGTYGLIFELSNPGLIFPGIVGVIAIVLALFSFGTLDANAAGIALMVFALLLFVAEVKITSHGLLTAGGIAALLAGAVIVFPAARPTFPGVRNTAEPLTLIVVVGLTAAFFVAIVRLAVGFRRLPVASGSALLLGAVGVAKSDLSPRGVVHVADDDWSAVASGGAIKRGAAVRVQRVDGVRLIVEAEGSPSDGKGSS